MAATGKRVAKKSLSVSMAIALVIAKKERAYAKKLREAVAAALQHFQAPAETGHAMMQAARTITPCRGIDIVLTSLTTPSPDWRGGVINLSD